MKKLMMSILTICLMVLSSGCTNPDKVNIIKPKIDRNLKTIERKDIKSMANMSSIALEWSIVQDNKIKGYNIYRSNTNKGNRNFVLVGSFNNRFVSHFVDRKLQPNTTYYYSISTIGKNGTQSKSSLPYKETTKKVLSSVGYIVALTQLPGQTKIMWRPHRYEGVYFYMIQRSPQKVDKWVEIARVKGRLNAEYIDYDVHDNKTYRYRIFCVTYDGIKSSSSKIVSSKTKRVPKSPKNVTASTNQPKQVTISWEPPNDTKEIKYYKIYKGVGSTNYMFSVIAKVDKKSNSYIHKIDEPGVSGFYKVAIVDKDNLESTQNTRSTLGKTLGRPAPPIIIEVHKSGNSISFVWKSVDKRAVYYYVRKRKDGMAFLNDTQKIGKLTVTQFKDKDIKRGEKYIYTVQAVDKYGLMSLESLETSVEF